MKFGDVVFEGSGGSKDIFSGAIELAQHFLPGEDPQITHALIVNGFGLALEADPDHGVPFRQFTSPPDLKHIRHVMRADAAQKCPISRMVADSVL